jgi:hypothetical protein
MGGFQIKVDMPVIIFKQREFTRALREEVQTQMRQAAREFLRAVINRVPIDTGEARGTLLPLGRFLRVSVPIDVLNAKANKNPDTGEINAPLLFDFETTGKGEYFTVQMQLFHFWWNDFFTHNYENPQIDPPWHSIEDGVKAFMDYIKTDGYKRLPRLKEFLFVSRIKVDGGSVFTLPERPI